MKQALWFDILHRIRISSAAMCAPKKLLVCKALDLMLICFEGAFTKILIHGFEPFPDYSPLDRFHLSVMVLIGRYVWHPVEVDNAFPCDHNEDHDDDGLEWQVVSDAVPIQDVGLGTRTVHGRIDRLLP